VIQANHLVVVVFGSGPVLLRLRGLARIERRFLILQDFVTLSPGVHVSGNVTLGTGCFVGTGANFIEKLNIGAWTVIGAGSVIVGEVPADTTVVGIPGKIIKVKEPGWHLH